ncbi:unnamed protein product [Didymodactylos carnosus]|uniref:G-protein coupled receptors family 1 profile domain-containing protein n=1 Tax=Didymodactylos carnosus TaxID=1234261 RepID=A0A814HGB3_9BILA|nr:unnamed protein product [Didymodactylos carnosus]CAF3780142.1 unnamed protein product [Didymodactylos carnosus]
MINLNSPTLSKTKSTSSNAILFTVHFHKLYPWFLLPFGIIGSLLTIIIFTRNKFRRYGCSLLFVAESVMDFILITLNCVRLIIRYTFQSYFLQRSLYICRTYKFMTNFCNHCAVWILCVISLERAVVTKRTNWSKKVFSKNHYYSILLFMFFILFCLNGHYLLFFGIEQSDDDNNLNGNYTILKKTKLVLCSSNLTQPTDRYNRFLTHHFTWMDFIINSLIPFFIILIANLSVMHSVCMQRILLDKVGCRQTKSAKDAQLTYILFVSTFLFLLMTFPMRIFSIIEPYLKFNKDILILLDGIMRFLLYLDHGCGFYLYTFTGKLFRKELRKILLMFLFGRRRYNWSVQESKRHGELGYSNGSSWQQHVPQTQQHLNNSISSGGCKSSLSLTMYNDSKIPPYHCKHYSRSGKTQKYTSDRSLGPYGMKRQDFNIDRKGGLVKRHSSSCLEETYQRTNDEITMNDDENNALNMDRKSDIL